MKFQKDTDYILALMGMQTLFMGGMFLKLSNDVSDLKGEVSEIKSSLLVPEGDKVSKKFTVVIAYVDRNNVAGNHTSESYIGHGAVVESGGVFYLLSAAHVLVELEDSVKITPKNATDHIVCQCSDLYISPGYIQNGGKDFGLLKLEDFHERCTQNRINIEINMGSAWNLPTVGESVVANGKVFLRGTVTSAANVATDSRFSVVAHSVSGSSGALVFDDGKSAVGIVHGSTKHRGKHTGNGLESSAIVYCDSPVFHGLLCIKQGTLRKMMQWAEDIPNEIAMNSAHDFSVDALLKGQNGLAKLLQVFLNKKVSSEHKVDKKGDISLDQIMNLLLKKVKTEEANAPQFEHPLKLVCISKGR